MEETNVIRNTIAVRVDAVRVSGTNPRKTRAGDPALQALAESMAGTGLISPIVVRPNPEPTYPEKWELLAGSRRLAAAKLLGWETIEAVVREVEGAQAQAIIVAENLQRENLSPLEEARGLRWLLNWGTDKKAVAKLIGWPLSRVARRAQLLKLIPQWYEFQKEQLPGWTAAHFELIARLPEVQQQYLAQQAKNRAHRLRTVADLEKFVQDSLNVLSRAPWKLDDADGFGKAGACSACEKRSSVQPELFWTEEKMPKDLRGHDRCLDRRCYLAKMKAFRDRAIAQAREKNAAVLLISTDYYGAAADGMRAPEGTLFKFDWKKAKKSDAGSMQGVIVHGSGIGQTRWVTLTKQAKDKIAERRQEKKAGGSRSRSTRTEPTAQERAEKLEAQRLEFVAYQIGEALEKVDPMQLILPAGSKIWTLMSAADQVAALERFLRWVLLFGIEMDDPFELADLLNGHEALSGQKLIRKVWDGKMAAISWWIEDQAKDRPALQALCEFTGFLVYDDLYASACEKYPDPAPAEKPNGKQRSSKKAAPGFSGSGISAGVTEGGEAEGAKSDPLANEHGVFTKETAGDRLEVLTVKIPAKWKFKIQFEVVQASSWRWFYGYRFSYGAGNASSGPASLNRASFEARATALGAAVAQAEKFIAGNHGCAKVPESHRKGARAALERFEKKHVDGAGAGDGE